MNEENLQQEIYELEEKIEELQNEIEHLENELTYKEEEFSDLEVDLEKLDNKIIDLEYDLFIEKTRGSKNNFYWFTSKKRPPTHVTYSNKEKQFFGFREVPQYKFIEYHDLRFIINATLDDLIEQFK